MDTGHSNWNGTIRSAQNPDQAVRKHVEESRKIKEKKTNISALKGRVGRICTIYEFKYCLLPCRLVSELLAC